MMIEDNKDDFLAALDGDVSVDKDSSSQARIGAMARDVIKERVHTHSNYVSSEESFSKLEAKIAMLNVERTSVTPRFGASIAEEFTVLLRGIYRFIAGPVGVGGMTMSILGLTVALNMQMTADNYEIDSDRYVKHQFQNPWMSDYNTDSRIVMRGGENKAATDAIKAKLAIASWEVFIPDPNAETKKWQKLLLEEKIPHTIKFKEDNSIQLRAYIDNKSALKIFTSQLPLAEQPLELNDDGQHGSLDVIFKLKKSND
jgi:hypothetical protein